MRSNYLVEGVFGQPIEGREAVQVVADFDQLDLHAGLLRGGGRSASESVPIQARIDARR